jgi:GT2 family glycosyltransferase
VFPYSKQPDGTVGDSDGWCGFVIAKEIVERVGGVPRAELFWWAEDTEYRRWRSPNAGLPGFMVPDALVHQDAIRQGRGVPTWTYYYETRNLIYLRLHAMRRLSWFPRNSLNYGSRLPAGERWPLESAPCHRGRHLRRYCRRLWIRYPGEQMIEQTARLETEPQFSAFDDRTGGPER